MFAGLLCKTLPLLTKKSAGTRLHTNAVGLIPNQGCIKTEKLKAATQSLYLAKQINGGKHLNVTFGWGIGWVTHNFFNLIELLEIEL